MAEQGTGALDYFIANEGTSGFSANILNGHSDTQKLLKASLLSNSQ